MTSMRTPHRGWLLAVLLAGPFMAQADATVTNVATPSIHTDLGASGAALELVVGGYLIAFAVLLITGARLGQTHGYRRVFLLGAGLFTAASLLCGLAPNAIALVVARVAQGCGAALMFPQTLTGIQLNFTGSQWRAIFLINLPVGVLVIAAALHHLPPDGQRTPRRLDLAGAATLCAGLLLLVVPLALGRGEGWPAWTWLCLTAGAATVAAFPAVERRIAAHGGAPLVAVAVLAGPAVGAGDAARNILETAPLPAAVLAATPASPAEEATMEEHFVWMTTRRIKPGTLTEFERAWRPDTHPEGMLRAYAYWSEDGEQIIGVSSWASRQSYEAWRASEAETRRRAAMAPYILDEQEGSTGAASLSCRLTNSGIPVRRSPARRLPARSPTTGSRPRRRGRSCGRTAWTRRSRPPRARRGGRAAGRSRSR